jgi:L-threonylcarbamoyladenylate synthase
MTSMTHSRAWLIPKKPCSAFRYRPHEGPFYWTVMPPIYDTSVEAELLTGMRLARTAVGRGDLVVIPTDTVYGVAADAFTPAAVTGLLAAKNRGRTMPVPVLIGEASTLAGLVVNLSPVAHQLAEAFWPGGLTLVLEHAPSLAWDLGDAEGTVAVRLPDDEVARDLLRRTGPLAVSSANRSGRPAASTAQEAIDQLGTHAAVVLDGGPRAGSAASTIVDCTGPAPRVLRVGAIGVERLREVVPEITD